MDRKIDCIGFGELVKDEIRKDIEEFNLAPSYTCYIIEDSSGNVNPASERYVSLKQKSSNEVGVECRIARMNMYDFAQELLLLEQYPPEEKPRAILQLPAPKVCVDMFNEWVDKGLIIDVDHLGSDVIGDLYNGKFNRIGATPRGIMALLNHIVPSLEGKRVAVIGSRSKTTGQYLPPLLQAQNATVTMFHSRSVINITTLQNFDIIISCVGKAGFITGDMIHLCTDKILIDVGVSVVSGKVKGDFAESCREDAHQWTPYVNGVGLLTRIFLIRNVVDSYLPIR